MAREKVTLVKMVVEDQGYKGKLYFMGKHFISGIFSGLGSLLIYIIVAIIIIKSESFTALQNAFGLRFGRAEFDKEHENQEGNTTQRAQDGPFYGASMTASI